MTLTIVDDTLPEVNETDKDALGGTELMKHALHSRLPTELLSHFQIIPSRVRELKKDKKHVLWLHDLPQDPESAHLKDGGWEKFDKIVYVSHWQKQQYQNFFNIPASHGTVLLNAIEPIEQHIKPDAAECVNIIYHTTPHRGLELLIPVLKYIRENHPEIKWHLDVYSSFKIYGWAIRDEPYLALFEEIKADPDMTYHGSVSNEEVREALKKAHVFALPSIWPETSCIALLEAMSAGCICVHSSLAALPETACNWTFMYDYDERPNEHATQHMLVLMDALRMATDENMRQRLSMQQAFIDGFYSWEVREKQWIQALHSVV
jgi:UDP-glucose:(glucosyl)LPS alpha-1,2-glucosyltransferase